MYRIVSATRLVAGFVACLQITAAPLADQEKPMPGGPVALREQSVEARLDALNVPPELRQVRSDQLKYASSRGVELIIVEKDGFSGTKIRGVPIEIRDMPIQGERDLELAIASLGPYLGFSSADDSLKIIEKLNGGSDSRYRLEQYIDGYRTGQIMTVIVDEETSTVSRIEGFALLDHNIPKAPNQTEREAIRLVKSAIRENRIANADLGWIESSHQLDLSTDAKTWRFYRKYGGNYRLGMWWGIGIKLKQPIQFSDGTVDEYQWYRVSPEGIAELDIDGRRSH
jgi:hypothetical protein